MSEEEKHSLIAWLRNEIELIQSAQDDIPFGLDDELSTQLKCYIIALETLEAEPVSRGETLPDGYCLVKKADILAVLRPSETSYFGFCVVVDGRFWDAGERIFKAAALEVPC